MAGNPTQAHRIYPAQVDIGAADASPPLSAYALQRPDGLWALLLVNKDPLREWTVTLRFTGLAAGAIASLQGPADLYQFSAAEYQWRANGELGRPQRSQPPRHSRLREGAPLQIPAWSLTVIRAGGPAGLPATTLARSSPAPER